MNIIKPNLLGAVVLLVAAGGLIVYEQPDVERKWELLAPTYQPRLDQREVQVEPAELLGLMQDDYIKLLIVDVRSESDWNMFHLKDAERIAIDELPEHRDRFADLPLNAVVVLVSNDEAMATRAWQHLMAIAKPNAYVLEGGLNHWLNVYGYPDDELHGDAKVDLDTVDGTLRHPFRLALGSRHPAASPDPHDFPERPHQSKVKLLKKVVKKGGCG
jgi:rhodanese-related sulfurtransferase